MSNRVTWGDGAYAGFWLRVAGFLVDWLLVGAVMFVLAIVLMFVTGIAFLAAGTAAGQPGPGEPAPAVGAAIMVVAWLVSVLPWFLYDTIMTSRFGWTLGKRAVGIEVRTAGGDLLSFGQAAGRWFGRIVSALPLYLGLLWAAWDPRKQTWHDKMVNCFVLSSASVPPAGQPASAVARPWGGQTAWGIPGAAQPAASPGGAAGGWDQAGTPGGTGGWGQPAAPEGTGGWGTPGPEEGVGASAAAGAGAASGAGAAAGAAAGVATPGEGGGSKGWARELSWDAGSPMADAGEGTPREPEPPGGEREPPEPGPEPADVGPEPADGGPEPAAGEPVPAAGEPEPAAPGPGPPAPDLGPEPGDREPEPAWESEPAAAGAEPGGHPAPDGNSAPADANLVGIERAGIASESAAWMEQVAGQVDSRLDRLSHDWRSRPHAEAARACAFGLLLGHLATLYPHMRDDLARVAEAHPSFSTLGSGDRLATLESMVGDPRRATAWLGPLVGVEDPGQLGRLLD